MKAERLRMKLERMATSQNERFGVTENEREDAERLIEIGDAFQRGIAFYVLNRFADADASFSSAVEDFGYSYHEPLWWRANCAFAAGEYDKAIGRFQSYLAQVEPNSVTAIQMVASCLMKTTSGSRIENYHAARRLSKEATTRAEIGTVERAKCLTALGDTYRMYDLCPHGEPPADLSAAEAAYSEATSIYASLKMPADAANVAIHSVPAIVNQGGDADEQVFNLQRAVRLLDRTLLVTNSWDHAALCAEAHNNRGACISRLADLGAGPGRRAAIRDFMRAKRLVGTENRKELLAKLYENLAREPKELPEFHWGIGQVKRLRYLYASLELWGEVKGVREAASAHAGIADCWFECLRIVPRRLRQGLAYLHYRRAARVYGYGLMREEWGRCHLRMACTLCRWSVADERRWRRRINRAQVYCDRALRAFENGDETLFRAAKQLREIIEEETHANSPK